MSEMVFEVTQEADGGYCAECLTLDIFTQADDWDELRANVREAVRGYFFDGAVPGRLGYRARGVAEAGDPRCCDLYLDGS